MNGPRLSRICMGAIFCFVSFNPQAAAIVLIDDFSIMKNGNTLFHDSFDNNVPPPDTGGNTQSYKLFGSTLGPETGGKLTLAGQGDIVTRPDAGTMMRDGARVQTNIDPLQPTNGLRSDDLFSVTGIFDISLPADVRERYGVGLSDAGSSLENNSVGISVIRTSPSLVEVVLYHYDQTAFTLTDIASLALETNHDQIVLALSRLELGNNEITGSFAYIDEGSMGAVTTFGTTVPIFDGEDFTRAQFVHLTPVIVPPDDADSDGVADVMDNCINVANADQRDTDSDGYGNLCDADLNNGGGVVNFADLALFKTAFGTSNPEADFDGNGFVNFADLATFKALFGKAPGPSCCGTLSP